MIQISREEAALLHQHAPSAWISVTGRQGPARKKTYYAEASREVLRLIDEHRRTATLF